MNTNEMNHSALESGKVTMNGCLYEALMNDSSDSFQMVLSPIYFKNRILDGDEEIPYISNHVMTSKGDHYLCFTMEPAIASIEHVVVKITSEEMSHIVASIEFKNKHPSIVLKKPTSIISSNISLDQLQGLKFLQFAIGIVENGVGLTSGFFAGGVAEDKTSSISGVALPVDKQTSVDLYDHEAFPIIFHSTTIETELRFDCNDAIDLGTNKCEASYAHYEKHKLSLLVDTEDEVSLGL